MTSSAKSITALISAVKIDALLGNLCFMDMLFMIAAHPTLSLSFDLFVSIEMQYECSSLTSLYLCIKTRDGVSFLDKWERSRLTQGGTSGVTVSRMLSFN